MFELQSRILDYSEMLLNVVARVSELDWYEHRAFPDMIACCRWQLVLVNSTMSAQHCLVIALL